MTLTDRETTWAVMIIPLVISLGWGVLLTWITIKAQHAKSIDEIKDETKKIFVRLFLLASNSCAVLVLAWEFKMSAPISRKDVFLIVWSVSLLLMSLILKLITIMREMSRVNIEHFYATKELFDLVKKVPAEASKKSSDQVGTITQEEK